MKAKKVSKLLATVLALTMTVSMFSCCEAKAEEQQVVNYWSFYNEGEPNQRILQQAIDDYEEETGVKVNVVWAGREVLTKVQARVASPVDEDFPDIVDQGSAVMMDLHIKNGLLAPVDEYLATPNEYTGAEKWSDQYIGSLLGIGLADDGQIYLIPRESYCSAFFYNKKIFRDLGIEIPKTWDELMAAAETIKASGIAPFSLDGNFDRNNAWWFTRMAEHVVGIDAIRQACEGKITYASDPGFLQVAQLLEDIVEKEYFQDNYEGSVWPACQVLWVQSQTAMIPCGTWLVSEMSDSTPADFEMGVFAWPAIEGEKYPQAEEAWGNYWGIMKDAPHKDAAIDFLKYTSQKVYDDAFSDQGTPSTQVDGKPIVQIADQATIIGTGTVVSDVMGGLSTYGDYFNNVYNKTISEMMIGKLTAEECIQKLDEETAKYYGN